MAVKKKVVYQENKSMEMKEMAGKVKHVVVKGKKK